MKGVSVNLTSIFFIIFYEIEATLFEFLNLMITVLNYFYFLLTTCEHIQPFKMVVYLYNDIEFGFHFEDTIIMNH